MNLIELKQRSGIKPDSKLNSAYQQLNSLLKELTTRDLTDSIVILINKNIEELNLITGSGKELKKQIKKKQCTITKSLEKELKIVPKNHYRNLWMAIGMAVFGVPFGVAFGAALGNMAFLGIGLPIGMAVGIAVGTGMDKKAFDEGRQLDLEIKH